MVVIMVIGRRSVTNRADDKLRYFPSDGSDTHAWKEVHPFLFPPLLLIFMLKVFNKSSIGCMLKIYHTGVVIF